MRKWLYCAVGAACIAAPAFAQDRGGYVGIEGGLLFPRDIDLDETVVFAPPTPSVEIDDASEGRLDNGFDVDLIGGYDFGMFRAELELGYKSASVDELGGPAWDDSVGHPFAKADGDVRVWSAMGNVLLDLDTGSGFSLYAGGGLGFARVKLDDVGLDDETFRVSESESGFAWQLIAGARMAVTPSLDLGLKYRYFQGPELSYENEFPTVTQEFDGARFRSHSILASLIYNFRTANVAAPPPTPPPPPPPPPATQNCPDGSVILATEACPLPPPPPPPAPEPERG